MRIGDQVKATAKDGREVSGTYSGKTEIGYNGGIGHLITQPDGRESLVLEKFYTIKVTRSILTAIEVQLMEIIEEFRKDGYSDTYILNGFKRVLEGAK